MNRDNKQILKNLIPPIVLKIYHKITNRYGYFGNYSTWKGARKKSSGYDSDWILNKVKSSLLKVKNGEAIYERDSVLFDEIEYSWPLLSGLMLIASKNEGRLNIIDFGGSLGSTYFQNRKFLSELNKVRWNIVEQKHFVMCGKNYFEDDELKFYESINDCFKCTKPNAILFSSVLQYIEKPYKLLNDILRYDFDYILIDRTSFTKGNDKITIQEVPPDIYTASYPCWFFNKKKFLSYFKNRGYMFIEEFDDLIDGKGEYFFEGFISKKGKNIK